MPPHIVQLETCHSDIEGWSSVSHQMEMEVIDLVNEMRSQQQDCRTEGQFPPVHPLKYEPHLQCSSRYHSLWMAENVSLNHDSPGGDLGNDFYQRVENANYSGYAVGENIAAGYDSKSVVLGWMESDGHCSIIMSPDAEDIGVGYFMDEGSVYLHCGHKCWKCLVEMGILNIFPTCTNFQLHIF